MKKFLALILMVFLLSSYNKEPSPDDDLVMMYLLSSDIDYQIIQITDNLNDKYYNHKDLISEKFITYDSLTKQYVKFIDQIIDDLTPRENHQSPSQIRSSEKSNNYFFNNDGSYTLRGEEFLNKTNAYHKAATSLSDNYFITSRLDLTLNTKPIIVANKKKINHLNYYYKNVSLLGAILYLKNHKRKILEYENYFLYDCLLEQSKNKN